MTFCVVFKKAWNRWRKQTLYLGLQISSALITTYGERAVDVFYVKDAFGMQVTHSEKLDQIRRTVLEVIAENDEVTENSSLLFTLPRYGDDAERISGQTIPVDGNATRMD